MFWDLSRTDTAGLPGFVGINSEPAFKPCGPAAGDAFEVASAPPANNKATEAVTRMCLMK
jgi:hypothetical protein